MTQENSDFFSENQLTPKPRLKDPRRVEHLSPIGIYCNRRSERAPDLGAVREGENNLVTIEEFGTARYLPPSYDVTRVVDAF